MFPGEPRRQRIAEKGVGPFILGSAEASHHEGRVGNVLDHLRHGAPIAHALAARRERIAALTTTFLQTACTLS